MLRNLCITFPDFNIHINVSYLLPSGKLISTDPTDLKKEGPALFQPENLVRRHSLHVFVVNCVLRCLDSGFNHSYQDVVSRSRYLQFCQRDKPFE